MSTSGERLKVEAIVFLKVTSDLPLHPVPFNHEWHHLSGICLADPDFGSPGPVDLLLRVNFFSNVLLHGRRFGPSGSPTAFETHFGWVLSGTADCEQPLSQVVSNQAVVLSSDDLLQRFWEIKEPHVRHHSLSLDEQSVMTHFQRMHRRDETGCFFVPLPRKSDAMPLGESRSLAVCRFLSLECSLQSKNKFQELSDVIEMSHVELFPKLTSTNLAKMFSTCRCMPELEWSLMRRQVIYRSITQRSTVGWHNCAFPPH